MEHARAHKGDGRAFADMDEVDLAYQLGQVDVHSKIKVRLTTWYDDKGDRLPERGIPHHRYHRRARAVQPHPAREGPVHQRQLEKGGVKDLIAEVYELCGQEVTTEIADAHQGHRL